MSHPETQIDSHLLVTAESFSPFQGDGWKSGKDYVSILDRRATLVLPETKRKAQQSRLYFRARSAGPSASRTLRVSTQGTELASYSLSKEWSDYELRISPEELKKPNIKQLQFSVSGESKSREAVADFESFRLPAYSWSRTKVQSEVRSCLLSLTPSNATFHVQIPAGKPHLFFGFAVSSTQNQKAAFEVKLNGNSIFRQEASAKTGWVDQKLELSSTAGKSAKLEFVTTPVGKSITQVAWSSMEIYDISAKTDRPNVILFSIDTLRSDRVGNRTPNLNTLAAQSIVFKNAYCTFPSTLPSHTSLMTGLYVAKHQVARPTSAVPRTKRIAADLPTIAELASQEKYFTSAITDGGFVSSFYGFDQGFQQYADNEAGEKLRNNVATIDNAMRWLDLNSQRPFFLFLHTYKVHEPFSPPPDVFRALFPNSPLKPEEDPAVSMEWLFQVVEGKVKPSESEKQRVRDCYDAEVSFFDRHFGRLLSHLKKKGLDRNTVILVTADHGEQLFDRGDGFGHGKTLLPEEMKVPFILYIPGRKAEQRTEIISLVDVLPTLAEIMKVQKPPSTDGISVLGSTELNNRSIYYEVTAGDQARWGIQNHEFKLEVDHTGKESFYDIRKDPAETKDLTSAQPRAMKIMKDLLAAYIRQSTSTSPHTKNLQEREESKELREQLKALGYIN